MNFTKYCIFTSYELRNFMNMKYLFKCRDDERSTSLNLPPREQGEGVNGIRPPTTSDNGAQRG